MSIIERIKNICLTPNTEWPVITQEPATPGGLLIGYAAPLEAIGAISGFIGTSLLTAAVGVRPTYALIGAIFAFVVAVIGVAICAVIVNVLAPTFGGQKDLTRAF